MQLFKTYLQNGICIDDSLRNYECEDFYIQKLEYPKNTFTYSYDSLIHEALNKLVLIYDVITCRYFPDYERYQSQCYNIPSIFLKAGLESDFPASKEDLEKYLGEYSRDKLLLKVVPDLNKFIYVGDCHYLVSSLQNLLEEVNRCFIKFYIKLAEAGPLDTEIEGRDDGIYWSASSQIRDVHVCVENYFIKANAVLDLFCKIVYEIENIRDDFSIVPRFKSKDKLWSAKRFLKMNKLPGTIFEECDIINMIIAIRNQVIHNGTLEIYPKMFYRLQNKQIIERFILFPDMEGAHFVTFKNRNHFYHNRHKVNDFLIAVHKEFLNRVLTTAESLLKLYPIDSFYEKKTINSK